MSTVQSLKSANLVRVDTGRANVLYSASRTLGESLLCPAGAQEIQNDVYGRPASQSTLPVNRDASCAMGTMYPAPRMIAVENLARPYVPICAAGLRGAGDFMGVGRDLAAQDLYGMGRQGDFIRNYNTHNNAPPDFSNGPNMTNYYQRREQPFSWTMDATKQGYYKG